MGAPGKSAAGVSSAVYVKYGPFAPGHYNFLQGGTHGAADICIGCSDGLKLEFG